MDQHIAEPPPAKYFNVLLEMRRVASPWLNMLYLSGLAETLALIARKNIQHPGSNDLKASAIARVLRAWGDYEGDAWTGGFVLEIRDSVRVYVESRADGANWGLGSVSVEPMPPESALPKLPPHHDSELYGWVEDLPELDDYLRRLR